MADIKDYDTYTNGMRKGIMDKLFFIDKIDSDSYFDFGCADGSLINSIKKILPEASCIGYDIDTKMIERNTTNSSGVSFISDLDKYNYTNETLILSSVIHEVYSYGSYDDIKDFWEFVFTSDFKYICIRDMMPSKSINRESNINNVVKVMRNSDKHMVEDFENVWGTIENNKNLVHFLMKYKYKENWEREVRENYFPLYREDFLRLIPKEYNVYHYQNIYHTPSAKNIEKDYDIKLEDKTHVQFILEKA